MFVLGKLSVNCFNKNLQRNKFTKVKFLSQGEALAQLTVTNLRYPELRSNGKFRLA